MERDGAELRRRGGAREDQEPPNTQEERREDTLPAEERRPTSSWSLWTWIFGDEPDPPEAMASELHSNMKREYGDICPDFVPLSFRDATTLAKNEGKFLVIYLHSEVHQDTPAFCRETLCTDEFHAFALSHDNVIFWAGSVLQPEGYSVSLSLGAASFPFLALVISTPRGLNIVEKIQGNVAKDQLVAQLNSALLRNEHHLVAVRAQEQFRTESQLLREQQDREYYESLEADRRKAEVEAARQEREEAEARARQEREEEEARLLSLKLQEEAEAARKAQEEREAAVTAKRQRLENGPKVKGRDTAFIRFQLHNGTKLERLFWAHDTFQTVRDFIDVEFFEREIAIINYELATNFPRKCWGPTDVAISLADAGLTPQALLYVQDLDS
ncbi:unnamed protein product [Aphanomyces euteiches]|uniref:UBX domain-containing protein n=1 Tax=Aphanomyces euteiches TaxID=100861 RepID=A0A6G0X0Z8_9STRA|nr:hypothetical protein Ae201684_009701 [Aphanomyces euteiches]KAH9086001.1 hypothetical protein Ae201684P_005697 [Aphanomyces euteiches]KAH9135858.1 hypothetical protein AeRB84_018822 [Aphanomyces euteiches]